MHFLAFGDVSHHRQRDALAIPGGKECWRKIDRYVRPIFVTKGGVEGALDQASTLKGRHCDFLHFEAHERTNAHSEHLTWLAAQHFGKAPVDEDDSAVVFDLDDAVTRGFDDLTVLFLALSQGQLGLLVPRPVRHHRQRSDVLRLGVPERRGLEQGPQLGAVLSQKDDLALLRDSLARAFDPHRCSLADEARHQLEQGLSAELIDGLAEHLGEPMVHEGNRRAHIHRHDALVRRLHDTAVTLLALAQRLLGLG